MKIIFVIDNIENSGGTERVTCDISSALTDLGHEVEILSLFGPGCPYFPISPSIKIVDVSLSRVRHNPVHFLEVSRAIYHHQRRAGANIVVLVDTILFLFCLPWARRSSASLVSWEHFNLAASNHSRFRVLARQAAARWSDAIIVLTEYDAQAWKDRFGLESRVHVIRNPMPHFESGPSTPADRRKIVLAIGRLEEQKGFDILLYAWHLLDAQRRDWGLRIIGDGSDRPMLEQLAKDLNIEDTVEFAGTVKGMDEEYRAASVYVLSSRWEGLSMTLVEAQHFVLPSVATDCKAGPREVLKGGTSGLLVNPEDPGALASGMARLMQDKQLYSRLAKETFKNAEMFEPETVRNSWSELLASLAEG